MNGEFDNREEAGWPPENTVFRLRTVMLRVEPGEHPFHVREKQRASENWVAESRANPALFDGSMVFQDKLAISNGDIRATGHIVPYSTFLWWRRQPGGAGGFHVFALPVPVSSDGAIIAIRMAPHTANAGLVYCPAGSLDASDVVDGICDIHGNMVREVREETGLDLTAAAADADSYALHCDRRVALFRCFRFPLTADEMLERIAAHMAVDADKEIDAAVAIRSADPAAHPYQPAMLPLLEWFFGEAAGER